MKMNFILDVDGVMTSGRFFYSSEGKIYKEFGPHDADGLKMIRDQFNITFITADKRGFTISEKRITDMGYKINLVTEQDRHSYVRDNFGFENTIYMGDGIHDAPLIRDCKFGISPKNARIEAKEAANFVTPSNSAEGAVCDACIKIKDVFLKDSLKVHHIDETNRYKYCRIQGKGNISKNVSKITTTFIHKGSAKVSIKQNGRTDEFDLKALEGFIMTPGLDYSIETSKDFDGFQAESNVDGKEIIEFIDDGISKKEITINGFKIIKNPKIVSKPWGHEIWIVWFKNHHVLKQIFLTKGSRSSLQYHKDKLETNYFVEGKAGIIKNYVIDNSLSLLEQVESAAREDWSKFVIEHGPRDWCTFVPGDVHRIIAKTDFLAYEVSTPELDDVIRLHDDKGRHHGRITEEHLK
jgi:3-deoxy-D-manno-octulosonate 8-phosphate phosphatase (KDO 8-P phosphatase)